jgi:predicted acylesterase/phospholipase RssA
VTVATFLRRGRRAAAVAAPQRPGEVVVLSGGGRLGAAQVGALRALLEAGIVPDAVVGSSVGAINAAYLAMDPTLERLETLERIWRGLSRSDVFPDNWFAVARRLARRSSHLYSPERLRTLLAEAIPQPDLADAVVPCHVVTTDLHTGEAVWWSSGDPVEVLSASASLPGCSRRCQSTAGCTSMGRSPARSRPSALSTSGRGGSGCSTCPGTFPASRAPSIS